MMIRSLGNSLFYLGCKPYKRFTFAILFYCFVTLIDIILRIFYCFRRNTAYQIFSKTDFGFQYASVILKIFIIFPSVIAPAQIMLILFWYPSSSSVASTITCHFFNTLALSKVFRRIMEYTIFC